MANDGTTAPLVVGMVQVNCPACGELVTCDVRVGGVATKGGSYLVISFQDETPEHRCAGRRS